jgi:D-alanyl-D-alanine carboxypeptidase
MFGSPFRHSDFGLLRAGALFLGISASAFGAASSACATPAIVIDEATGDVLYSEQATETWYPASLTKLMTFYVALNAVRDKKITLDTPIVISPRAYAAAPSKMGFKPGTEVTLGNALKMMIVKSANDIAIAVAEAVSGSVEAFAEDMNATATQLGMRQSHFVNPNGLPDPEHVSSARDLAVLARAIYVDYPQEAAIFSIGALRLGDEILPTHNTLLGRYPGADGMKTGFTCSAGFNLVASAERNDHRYIAVVLGAPNVELRMMKTAVLLDRAFDGIDHPQDKLDTMPQGVTSGTAPDMHNEICRRRSKASLSFQTALNELEAPLLSQQAAPAVPVLGLITGANSMAPVAPTIAQEPRPVFDPVPVTLGPETGYQGPIAQARPPHSPVGTPSPQPAVTAVTTTTQPQKATDAEDTQQSEDTEETPKPKEKAKVHTAKEHHKKPAAQEAAAKPKPLHHHIAKAKPKTEKTDTAAGDTTEPDTKATDTTEKKDKIKHHAQKKTPAVKQAKKLPKKHLEHDTAAKAAAPAPQ